MNFEANGKIGMTRLLGGARGAMKVRSAQGSALPPSKVIQLGNSYRFFFATYINEDGQLDIRTATEPGRQLNYDLMGKSFVPLREYEVSDTKKIMDLTGLVPYARLARVLHDAACRAEKAKVQRDAERDAEDMGREVDVAGLKVAKDAVEVKYHGDPDHKPNPIYAEVSPAIGGLKVEVATECLVVPLTAEGKPELSKATPMALSLSNRKLSQLITLLDNPDYCDPEAGFLEVHYVYNGTSRQDAGQSAVYQGVSKDTSLATKYPTEWESGKGFLESLPKSEESIRARNMSLSSSVTAKEVVQLFNKYVSKHEVTLLHLDYDDDVVKAAAEDLLTLEVVKSIPKVQDQLIAIVNEKKAKSQNTEEEEVGEGIGTGDADISKETMDAVTNASSLRELDAAVGDLDAVTGGVDLEDI